MTVSILIFWSLNKGLVFKDEAYYHLLLTSNNEYGLDNLWTLVARHLFSNNIYFNRVIIFALNCLASITLSFGIYKYLKLSGLKELICLLGFSLLGNYILMLPVQFFPYYATLNIVIILLAVGLVLTGLASGGAKYYTFILTNLAGIILGILPFIMITNTSFIILVLCFIVGVTYKTERFLPSVVGLIIGLICSMLLTAYYIVGPDTILLAYEHTMFSLQFDKTHGFGNIFIWIINTIFYIATLVIIYSIPIYIWERTQLREGGGYIFTAFLALAITFLVFMDFLEPSALMPPSLPLVLLFWQLFYSSEMLKKNSKVIYLITLLFLIPFSASLGTDVSFKLRSTYYMSSVFIIVYLLISFTKRHTAFLYLHTFLFIAFIHFGTNFYREGWGKYIIADQVYAVNKLNINQSILLDEERFENLAKIKHATDKNDRVILSTTLLYGYAALLDLHLVSNKFKLNEEYFKALDKKNDLNLDGVIFIEKVQEPFTKEFKRHLLVKHQINLEEYSKFKINDITVFKAFP
ncbi:hypothetical protein ACSX1A_07660 [Pontibacter sp. MBLB2868]|uniref:hypothetical protein n=1 Tax=Pontibacter sp. MBLB2868 TaxID=3451555 RepID=UPI003F74E557